MPDTEQHTPGPEHAAILLMTLGEHEAAEILKHMQPKEVQALGNAMTQLGNITQDQISEVLDLFVNHVRNQSSLGLGSSDYFKNVLHKALGEEKAGSVLPSLSVNTDAKGLEALKWMAPRTIVDMIQKEHPQIIAIVLVHLDADVAGEVLTMLPEDVRPEVIMRIATLDGVQPSALRELEQIMELQLSSDSSTVVTGLGGAKAAADILNGVPPELESGLIEKINELDATVGEEIQNLMFTFDNLNDIDDRGIQTLLREISSEVLVVALKGAEPETRDKIFRNMSSRAAELLREDLEAKGPVRLSEVEAAQKEILVVVQQMAEEGKIILKGKGEAFV